MSFSLGIVGLPNVGKSTLFNALSNAKAEVSNYPFCTIDPNVGVVEVPDVRVVQIQKMMDSGLAVPTIIEFVDIAGLVKGAHQGEGLGNKFLSHIREVDAILHLVRCFKDEEISHVPGEVDPQRDVEIINLELELGEIKKPIIYVANVDETGNPQQVAVIKKIAEKENAKVVAICAKLEAEIRELSANEAEEYAKAAGMQEFGLKKLIRSSYELLDLITFFTANKKEARAWTLKRGQTVLQAAAKIHTDMAARFIAAEVIKFEDLAQAGSYLKAKEQGLVHTQGKEYLVQDGDLILIRFGR